MKEEILISEQKLQATQDFIGDSINDRAMVSQSEDPTVFNGFLLKQPEEELKEKSPDHTMTSQIMTSESVLNDTNV